MVQRSQQNGWFAHLCDAFSCLCLWGFHHLKLSLDRWNFIRLHWRFLNKLFSSWLSRAPQPRNNRAKHLVNDFASHIACRNLSKLNKHARDYSIEFKKSDFIEFIQKSNQTERKPRKKTTIGRKKFNSAVQNTTGTWKEKSEENPEVQQKFWNHLNSRNKQSKVTRNHWNPPEIRRKFSRAARGVRKTWKIWKCIQCK